MEQKPVTTDPVAAALVQGYKHLELRMQELDEDTTLNPEQRHNILMAQADLEFSEMASTMDYLTPRWKLEGTTHWVNKEPETMEDYLDPDLSEARPLLLDYVTKLAAHPWQDLTLENSPHRETTFDFVRREDAVAKLDNALEMARLTPTKQFSALSRRWEAALQGKEPFPPPDRSYADDGPFTTADKKREAATLNQPAPSKAAETARKLRAYQEATERDRQQQHGMDNGPQRDRGPRHSL